MSDQMLSSTTNGGVTDTAANHTSPLAEIADVSGEGKKKKKKKKDDKPLEERKVYEAGGVIVCDGKVVLRLTDKQRWIFPKGKVKKRESAQDAATREATEETGLKVEVVDQGADLLIRHEGKKRRFVFFLMRATAKTWDWPHHEGRDTFLISSERVSGLLRHQGYASVWEACRDRVKAMVDDPTPFVSRPSASATAASPDKT
ncbi:MAG TPA: NUDIX domain-containing protein [Chloroflexota bacterium]|nr:NUDIX domain-containing protein [Chloroflexota bacterium]